MATDIFETGRLSATRFYRGKTGGRGRMGLQVTIGMEYETMSEEEARAFALAILERLPAVRVPGQPLI